MKLQAWRSRDGAVGEALFQINVRLALITLAGILFGVSIASDASASQSWHLIYSGPPYMTGAYFASGYMVGGSPSNLYKGYGTGATQISTPGLTWGDAETDLWGAGWGVSTECRYGDGYVYYVTGNTVTKLDNTCVWQVTAGWPCYTYNGTYCHNSDIYAIREDGHLVSWTGSSWYDWTSWLPTYAQTPSHIAVSGTSGCQYGVHDLWIDSNHTPYLLKWSTVFGGCGIPGTTAQSVPGGGDTFYLTSDYIMTPSGTFQWNGSGWGSALAPTCPNGGPFLGAGQAGVWCYDELDGLFYELY